MVWHVSPIYNLEGKYNSNLHQRYLCTCHHLSKAEIKIIITTLFDNDLSFRLLFQKFQNANLSSIILRAITQIISNEASTCAIICTRI